MRLGQISFVSFLSRIAASVVGFVATVLVTQVFGSSVFGTYMLVVAVVIWLKTIAIMGVRAAVVKRLSEGGDQGEFVTAGAFTLIAILAVLTGLLLLGRSYLHAYLPIPATNAVILLTWAGAILAFVTGVLQGRHRVHHASLLRPLNTGIRSIVHVVAVLLGLGVTGLLFGYGVGAVLAAIIGVVFLRQASLDRPRRRHFGELLSYARYAWLGRLSSQTFTSLDTVVLGFFVGTGLIGVYEASWNLASILAIFGTAIGQTLYPEISKVASENDPAAVRNLLGQGFRYAGLFLIPGLFGSLVIGDIVLTIYGSEFSVGHYVLVLLVLSRLVYAYADQLLTALNGIDRPDRAFRVNAAFVVTNLCLNFALVYGYGWIGAAVATAVSAGLALVLSVRTVRDQLGAFRIPYDHLGRQMAAAAVMALVVGAVRTLFPDGLLLAVALVLLGAAVYVTSLAGISVEFRRTVRDNLPSALR